MRAPKGGFRAGGKTYRHGQMIPKRYEAQLRRSDPATGVDDTPPNFGKTVLPQIFTFGTRISAYSNVYRNPDTAVRESIENARFMRNDTSIMECLEARQRSTALLNWHLETDDKDDPLHKQLIKELTQLMNRIPDFTELRRNLLEAIWYGRYAVQFGYGFLRLNGQRRVAINKWLPINGDKLIFRFDDNSGKYGDAEVGVKVGPIWPLGDITGNRAIEYTDLGPTYFLQPWERTRLAIHKHIIEDGAYEDYLSAGRIHGVGIRDRIYWTWFQKQETMAHMMEIIERTGAGFTIYYYPSGNAQAKAEMEDIAQKQTFNNVVIMPRQPGDPTMDAYGIDRIEPNASGIETMKMVVHDFFGHQIKRYILGQILSSESEATGLGSGVADLHQNTYLQIIKYDAVKLEETLTTQLVQPLKEFNFRWAHDIYVRCKIDTEQSQAEQKLAAFKIAWEMGAKLRASDVMDVIGAAVPTEDEETLQNTAAGKPEANPFDKGGNLPGGVGDKTNQGDLDQSQLSKGIKVEMEHTDDPDKAKEIATDHLTEDPKYYDKLKEMESKKYARVDEIRHADDLLRQRIIPLLGTGRMAALGSVGDYWPSAAQLPSRVRNAQVYFDPSLPGKVVQDGISLRIGSQITVEINTPRRLGAMLLKAAEQLGASFGEVKRYEADENGGQTVG